MTLEELKAQYNSATNHRERAHIEQLVWNLAPIPGKRRTWVCLQLGVGPSIVDAHRTLVRHSNWTEPLWPMLDAGMSSMRAEKVARKAVDISREAGIEPEEAIQKALAATSERAEESTTRQVVSRNFAQAIESLAREFVCDAAADAEPYVQKRAVNEFLSIINSAVNDLRNELNRARNKKPIEKITKSKFDHACEVLSFNGKYGKPIDLLAIKKLKNQRVFELHTDKHQSLTKEVRKQMELELQQVLIAFETFTSYYQQKQSSWDGSSK